MDKRELQDRTKQFALRALKLADVLPHSAADRAIFSQLIRAATSVGANYRSACRARSRAEFAAKLGIAVEEADESLYWLELVRDGKLVYMLERWAIENRTAEQIAVEITQAFDKHCTPVTA